VKLSEGFHNGYFTGRIFIFILISR
jgi:hypothetical protein